MCWAHHGQTNLAGTSTWLSSHWYSFPMVSAKGKTWNATDSESFRSKCWNTLPPNRPTWQQDPTIHLWEIWIINTRITFFYLKVITKIIFSTCRNALKPSLYIIYRRTTRGISSPNISKLCPFQTNKWCFSSKSALLSLVLSTWVK